MGGCSRALVALAVVALLAIACGHDDDDIPTTREISQVGEDGRVETIEVQPTEEEIAAAAEREGEEPAEEEIADGERVEESVTGEDGSVLSARAETDVSVDGSVNEDGSTTYVVDAGGDPIEITFTLPMLEPGVVPWMLPLLTTGGETLPLQGLTIDIGPETTTLAGTAPTGGEVDFVPVGWFFHPVDLWTLPGGFPFAVTAALDPASLTANLGVPTDVISVPGGQGIEVFGLETGLPDESLRVSLFVDELLGQALDPFSVAVGFRFDDAGPTPFTDISYVNSHGLFCSGPSAAAPDAWGMYRCSDEGQPGLGPVMITLGPGGISFAAEDFDPGTFSSVNLLFGPPNPDPRAIMTTFFFEGNPNSSILYFETGESVTADSVFDGIGTWTFGCAELAPLLGDGVSTDFFFAMSAFGADPDANAEAGHLYLDLAGTAGEVLGC